jgi:hypothetical protein
MFLTAGSFGLRGIGLAAIVVFLPFLAYLCSLLRHAEEEGGWLAQTAFAAGLAGITLKVVSIAPEFANRRYHIADGTPLHNALQGIADVTTDICLYPLGVMLAAAAVVIIRTRTLPRWLGYGAALTAVALVVNGAYNLYYHSGVVPALLLFLLWTLVCGVVLFRRTWRDPARVAQPRPAAA